MNANTNSFWSGVFKFLIGFLIGLCGWLAHTIIHTTFTYISADRYFEFLGSLGLIGIFFFIYGWEVIAIIAGIISLKKDTKKAFSFVATMVVILSFVVGGCTGLINN